MQKNLRQLETTFEKPKTNRELGELKSVSSVCAEK